MTRTRRCYEHFGIFGPPTIAFYGADGMERRNFRVVGFMKAAEFAAVVRQAVAPATPTRTVKSSGSSTPRLLGAALDHRCGGRGRLLRVSRCKQPTRRLDAAERRTPTAPAAPPAPDRAASAPKQKSIPDTLPDITLADRDGKPTKLASFGGRPLMVNFWATWCAPCRREIPLLNKIRMERKAQNAEIVGIAVDFRDDVLEFVNKTPLNYPLLIGEEDGLAAAEAFGMGMAFPFSVFVDSQNRILTVKIGELHEDEANFAFDRLRDIDNGVLTREAAQAAVADAFREMAAERAQERSGRRTNIGRIRPDRGRLPKTAHVTCRLR